MREAGPQAEYVLDDFALSNATYGCAATAPTKTNATKRRLKNQDMAVC